MSISNILFLISLYVTTCYVASVTVQCPHEIAGLKRWSDSGTWPGNTLPAAGQNVTISDDVLLDMSPPELFGITIESTGRLVWSPEGDYELVLKFIHIKGRFDIGSEDCPFTAKAIVTLIGERGQYKIPKFNEKFIGVDANGTFEVHGKKQISWTKLNATLPSQRDSGGLLFSYQYNVTSKTQTWMEGLRFYVIHQNGTILHDKMFYTSGDSEYYTDKTLDTIQDYVNGIPNDTVVLVAVQKSFINPSKVSASELEPVFSAIESVAGIPANQSLLRTVGEEDAYALATIKGDPSSTKETVEKMRNELAYAVDSLYLGDTELRFSAESAIYDTEYWKSYVDFRVSTKDASFPVLTLAEDVSSWEEGNKLVITSTDFDMDQTEEAVVVNFPDDNLLPNQVRVDLEACCMHYGEIEEEVDMRAEVGLLTRAILFRGRMSDTCPASNGNCGTGTGKYNYDTFGGHFKVVENFTDVHVEGAEFYHMGQQTQVGHYPIHFHMAYDVDGYPNSPYIRDNSIHRSFARCVTVHGTNGVTVMDNVAYDSLGHCYFLEDCGERRTVFDGNLGIYTRKGSIIPSDSQPATFWITNPNTWLRNNVAAGSEKHGFWFIYCDTVGGLSKDKGFMQYRESRYTALTEFTNNAAHSNENCGFFADNRLDENGNIISGNYYSPKENPLDPSSPDKETKIHRMTATKNRNCDAWYRGGYYNVTRASLADSAKGITFAISSHQRQFFHDSVLLGESNNVGIPKAGTSMTRSTPNKWNVHVAQTGFNFYDGPVFVENVYCNKYKHSQFYPMGCFGFQRKNKFSSSPVSSVKGSSFGFVDGPTTGNRVFDGDETVPGFGNLDGDKTATFRDLDGTVTTIQGAQVVKPGPFNSNGQCYFRSHWMMQYCDGKYGKFKIKIRSAADKPQNENIVTSPYMIREDIPDVVETQTGEKSIQFMAILGGDFSYQLHWNQTVPSEFDIRVLGAEKDEPVRLAICLPLDAEFDLYSYAPNWLPDISKWTAVGNVSSVDEDTEGGRYFWNSTSGMLYIKFLSKNERAEGELDDCTGSCPMVRITVTNGTRTDANCTGRAAPMPPEQQTTRKKRSSNLSFNTVKSKPDVGQGAGSMKPFATRIAVDGGFGEWGEWLQCSVTCGGGTQKRTRKCNNPVPANGGAMCSGDYSEQRNCNDNPCPVNGGWSDWSVWSSCIAVTQCNGYKTRNRSCSNPVPNYGGNVCTGYSQETAACVVSNC